MSKNNLTQNRIKSNKLLLAIAIIVATFTDILVAWLIFDAGYEWIYGLCTWIMLALDIIYFISIWFTNYRFAYSCVHWIVYIILSVIAIAVNIGIFISIPNGSIITYVASLFWVAVHIFAIGAVIMGALKASKIIERSKSLVALLCVLGFVVSVGAYATVTLQNGILGQNDSSSVRALIFESNESGGYTVSGVLDGRGDKIIIPETFNGEKVESVDMSVFTADKINTVVLQCDAGVSFTNEENLNIIPNSLKVEVPKKSLGGFRETFYEMATTYLDAASHATAITIAENLCNFANSIVPNDLSENDVYIMFNYGLEALEKAADNRLSVWIGQKGEKFDLDLYGDQINYVKYRDQYSGDDLYWNVINNGGYILSDLIDNQGNNIDGQTIINSVTKVDVAFEKIYKLFICDDNDLKYESPDEYKYSTAFGNVKNCRYVTASTAQSVIDSIPKRAGFNLSWQYSNSFDENKQPFTDIVELLNESTGAAANMYLYPVWELKKPTDVIALSTVDNNNPVYGEDIKLIAEAIPPIDGYQLQYTWEKEDKTQSQDKDFIIENIYPEQAGIYNLTVTAYSDTETSLRSHAETSITITVKKRLLDISWTLNDTEWPEDNAVVYSAMPNTVACSQNISQVINNDVITLTTNVSDGDAIIDAGKYLFVAELTGDSATKYQITSICQSSELTIKPYETPVQWQNNTEFVYNSISQAPTATASGLSNDLIEVSLRIKYANGVIVHGGAVNAGSYIAEAFSDNTNYKLLNDSIAFIINKAPLDALEVILSNWVYGETAAALIVNNNYGGGTVNCLYSGTANDGTEYNSVDVPVKAGTYTVNINVEESLNYESGTAETTFMIAKHKLIRPIESSETFIYNGTAQTYIPVGFEPETMNIEGNVQTNANENGYTVTVYIADEHNYEWATAGNDGEVLTYVIQKASLTVIAEDKSVTYGHEVGFEIKYSGFVGSDDENSLDELPVVSSEYNVGTEVSEGPIAITVSGGKAQNYTINHVSGILNIEKADLTIIADDQSVIYGDNIPEYTVSYHGFVNNENQSVLQGTIDFDCNYAPGTDVGELEIAVSGLRSGNYEMQYVSGKLTVARAILTDQTTEVTGVYNGLAHSLNINLTGFVNGENIDTAEATISYSANNGGDWSFVPLTVTSVSENKTIYYKVEFANYETVFGSRSIMLTPLNVNYTWKYADAGYVYNGREQGPSGNMEIAGISGERLIFTVSAGKVDAGSGYTRIAYFDRVTGGQADKNNYKVTGLTSDEYSIEKARITVSGVTAHSGVYDGQAHEAITEYSATTIAGQDASWTFKLDADEEYSSSMPTFNKVGTYKVNYKVSAPNHYDYEAVATVTILKATLIDETQNVSAIYDGDSHQLNITLTGFVNHENMNSAGAAIEYSVDENDWSDAAISVTNVKDSKRVYYRVSFENYETITGNRAINVESFAVEYVWSYAAGGYIYTGSEQGPAGLTQIEGANGETLSFIVGSGMVAAGKDYVRTAEFNKVNGGNEDKNNYTINGLTSNKYSIVPAAIEVSAVGYSGSYDGEAHNAFVTQSAITVNEQRVSWKYKTEFESEYTSEMPTFTEAGVYTVYYIVSAPNHYDVEGYTTVNIKQAENGWEIAPHIDDWNYAEVSNEPIGSAYFGTVKFTYMQGETVLDEKPTEIGDYTLIATVEESANYTGLSGQASFTIHAAASN